MCWIPSPSDRFALVQVALGKKPPDLVIHNAKIANVFTTEFVKGNIWIYRKWIAAVTDDLPSCSCRTIDVGGRLVIPGFIDGHIHLESTLLDPFSFSRQALKCGVTTIVTDLHEIAAVSGLEGVNAILPACAMAPVKILFSVPHIFYLSGYTLVNINYNDLLIVGYSEAMMNRLLTTSHIDILQQHGKRIDGHLFKLAGKDVDAAVAFGINSDHEVRGWFEAKEKISKGLFVMLRTGTLACEAEKLLPQLVEHKLPLDNVCIVTDDILCKDMTPESYMMYKLQLALGCGLQFVEAIRLITYNVARYYGLSHLIGAIKPGACADLVVLNEDLSIDRVICSGRPLEEIDFVEFVYPKLLINTIMRPLITKNEINCENIMQMKNKTIKAIVLDETTRITDLREINADATNGIIPEDLDLCYIVSASRYDHRLGIGFLSGYGLKNGAIATSISHDKHNIICVGKNLDDIIYAINILIQSQGGIVIVQNQRILFHLVLPIGGLMTNASPETVCSLIIKMEDFLRKQGVKWKQPIFYLFWLGMEEAPRFRITPDGVLDTVYGVIIDVL